MPVDVKKTLRRALSELESQKAVIDRQIATIRTVLNGVDGRPAAGFAPAGRRRPMSAAARRAVSARMKAYWAARKAGKAAGKAGKTEKAKKKAS